MLLAGAVSRAGWASLARARRRSTDGPPPLRHREPRGQPTPTCGHTPLYSPPQATTSLPAHSALDKRPTRPFPTHTRRTFHHSTHNPSRFTRRKRRDTRRRFTRPAHKKNWLPARQRRPAPSRAGTSRAKPAVPCRAAPPPCPPPAPARCVPPLLARPGSPRPGVGSVQSGRHATPRPGWG